MEVLFAGPSKRVLWAAASSLLMLSLGGCQFIGDVFKAGVWVGVLLVVLVIGGVVWLFTRAG
ncbi:MAG TPA: hypothetical protein VIB79_00340 [Candidatus Binatia bacterium]|jgi:hypothetical protein